ncbi:MAG: zinc metalloprotease HtpX [Candidatus Aminicenantaceae bacterium]
MPYKPFLDFYEIQRQQKQKSLILLLILILFYFFAIGFISIIFLISFGLILSKAELLSGTFLTKLFLFNVAVSVLIAAFQFFEAKKLGAKFIIKRLEARPPDLSDRYHKQFVNTLDEIRIASGLPKVTPYVLPSFAINSMALISADDIPNVFVTEGLLAEFTRDELQAVVSHELAHIIRGDAFYITLVCSLANFFERLRQFLEPEIHSYKGTVQTERGGAAQVPVFFAITLPALVMHLLSTLISRQREILADAAAVELNRNPRALARAIYKAHLKNSFVGAFNLTYSPLFIVPPESKGESDGFFARLFNSHPPLMKRIKLLSNMVKTSPARIIEEVWEIQKKREEARTLLHSREETVEGSAEKSTEKEKTDQEEAKVWAICDPKGKWQGPYALDELLFIRFFTPLIRVKNIQEGIEAPAREFPQIRNAIRNIRKKKPIYPARQNLCPRCFIPLKESFYEGVAIKFCPQCKGKLVESMFKERFIARKEVAFSKHLIEKAHEFKKKFMLNPVHTKKISDLKFQKLLCPNCGSRMLPRPFSYQYVIPVDKCFSCYKIWFDADELEILQILIEER